MYKEASIKDTIENLLKHKDVKLSQIKKSITIFFDKYDKIDKLNCVFYDETFKKICALSNKKPSTNFPSTKEDAKALLKIFEDFFELNIAEETKKSAIYEFIRVFSEYSEDEEYCKNRIYVVIKNLSEDGFEIVNEFNSWDETEESIEDIYVSCCDDDFLAENMWFPILCYARSHEYDTTKNFCCVLEFDAAGLEDAREYWEKNNH